MKIKELKNKLIFTLFYVGILIVFWGFKIPCIFNTVFGVPCPGCGMSRAFFSVLRFDFAAAFGFHPMFWSVPILYLYLLFDGELFCSKLLNKIVLILIAMGFAINWAVKILSLYL